MASVVTKETWPHAGCWKACRGANSILGLVVAPAVLWWCRGANEMWLRTLSRGTLAGRGARRRWCADNEKGRRPTAQDVSNTLAREVMNGIPALSSLMVEGQASEVASD